MRVVVETALEREGAVELSMEGAEADPPSSYRPLGPEQSSGPNRGASRQCLWGPRGNNPGGACRGPRFPRMGPNESALLWPSTDHHPPRCTFPQACMTENSDRDPAAQRLGACAPGSLTRPHLQAGCTYATVAAHRGPNQKRRIEEKTATDAPMGSRQ